MVPISIAPEAQRSLAPRFSVGKEARVAFQPRRGDAKDEIVIKISFMRLPCSAPKSTQPSGSGDLAFTKQDTETLVLL
jgi:hypothetical protein